MWNQTLILGLGVWLVYLVDRLADTAPHLAGDHATARHRFYQRQRRVACLVAAAVFIVLAWLAPSRLPAGEFLAGLGLLALTGGYFWLIHRRKAHAWPRLLPKEAIVGGFFAVGTAFFVLGQTARPTAMMLAALPMFGGLCFLNCALITKWERNPSDVREAASLLNAFPRLTARLDAGCLALASLAFAAYLIVPGIGLFLPMAVSALLLAYLDRRSHIFSADALRVLADAALLTPLVCSFLPLWGT